MTHEIAYIAGIFDADGCVTSKSNGRNLKACISLYAPESLYEILERNWGGNISHGKSRPPAWTVFGRFANPFLNDILPYSTVKKEQILLAIKLLQTYGTTSIGGRGITVDSKTEEKRELLAYDLRNLKRMNQWSNA